MDIVNAKELLNLIALTSERSPSVSVRNKPANHHQSLIMRATLV